MEDIIRTGYADVITMSVKPSSHKSYFKNINIRTQEKNVHDLERLSRAFRFSGGSETLPFDRILQFLFVRGYGAMSVWNGKVYFWGTGTPGGQNGQLLEPTTYTFSNAYTGANGTLKITGPEQDGVLWKCDHLMQGVMPILDKYNILLSHTDLSIYMTLVNSRLQNIGLAGRDAEAKAFEMVFDQLEDGSLKAIVDRNMLNKTTTLPNSGKTDLLTDLIEIDQFLWAKKWNELGLNANWNGKRESLSHSENLMNADALMPLLEDMLACFQESAEKTNELFGEYLEKGEIKVEFANAWEVNETEQESRQEIAEQAPEEMENSEDVPEPDKPEEKEEKDDESN